jgi:transcriptional regulator with XRE-family HTH domain
LIATVAVTTFKNPRIGIINSTKMTLGDRIQVLRKEKRLTQAGLASNIGVSIAQLTRYETQDVLPNADALKRMAMCFGITIDFLVNGTTAQKAESAISDAKLLGLFKQVELLSDEDRKVIFKLIEAFTIKKQLEHMLKQ